MSDYIVDASVAVKWFVTETDSLVADELSASRHRLFAPDLIFTETANALTRKATAGPSRCSLHLISTSIRSISPKISALPGMGRTIATAANRSASACGNRFNLVVLRKPTPLWQGKAVSRRDFIKKAMLLSGVTAAYGAVPDSIRKAVAINPAPGSTYLDAEHVVILMQENRSFDHCFGTLKGVRGFNDQRAIQLRRCAGKSR